VSTIRLTPQAGDDLDRLAEFLQEAHPPGAVRLFDEVVDALQILERHPLIGRPAPKGLRELVISRGKTGYLALYRYDDVADTVLVMRIRHQRELGFH
jgi:addiction module RelE/StbE family toxin